MFENCTYVHRGPTLWDGWSITSFCFRIAMDSLNLSCYGKNSRSNFGYFEPILVQSDIETRHLMALEIATSAGCNVGYNNWPPYETCPLLKMACVLSIQSNGQLSFCSYPIEMRNRIISDP